MNIVVREATNADAQLMAELTRAAWAGKVSVTRPVDTTKRPSTWQSNCATAAVLCC